MSPRPGFNIYLPRPEGRTGRGLAVPYPDTPPPRVSSRHHATPAALLINRTRPETEAPTRVLRRGCGAGGDASGGCDVGWSWGQGSAGRFSVTLSPCGGERAGGWWRGLPERTRGWRGKARGRRIWGRKGHSVPMPRPRGLVCRKADCPPHPGPAVTPRPLACICRPLRGLRSDTH